MTHNLEAKSFEEQWKELCIFSLKKTRGRHNSHLHGYEELPYIRRMWLTLWLLSAKMRINEFKIQYMQVDLGETYQEVPLSKKYDWACMCMQNGVAKWTDPYVAGRSWHFRFRLQITMNILTTSDTGTLFHEQSLGGGFLAHAEWPFVRDAAVVATHDKCWRSCLLLQKLSTWKSWTRSPPKPLPTAIFYNSSGYFKNVYTFHWALICAYLILKYLVYQ